VSLAKYREESKKIFAICRRFSTLVEKASCDEAFIDVTQQVNLKYSLLGEMNFPKEFNLEGWKNAYMMGYPKGEGLFIPESELDKKLFIASDLAYQMRKQIDQELGYKASCGISHNKTIAKLASSANKPNAQTVVPVRYMRDAMKNI
jgi:DNA polymerase eta